MPCGGNDEASKRAKDIERRLRKERFEMSKVYKILLLGTGESGKSTIIKQMRILYGRRKYEEADRLRFRELVYRNMLTAMRNIVDAMSRFDLELEDSTLEDKAYELQDLDIGGVDSLKEWGDTLKRLWSDPGVQEAYRRRNEYQLSDSTGYYYKMIDQVLADDYVPTIQCVLRAREATTGIHEYSFDLEPAVFRMIDVGGQRSERRKWIHCFEGVTSIIFIAASSEYDQFLVEDDVVNRMSESLALFEQIANYVYFRESSMILFLNKTDILKEKIKTSSIKRTFPEFQGNDKNADEVLAFIRERYLERAENKKGAVFTHFTEATNTNNIKFVFDSVRSTLLKLNMNEFGIL